jgi:hypothetical protein
MGKVNYDDDHDQEILIIFLFLAIALGAVVTFAISRYAKSVPYTVVMFLFGAVMVGTGNYFPSTIGPNFMFN